jgi:hypothetical protein
METRRLTRYRKDERMRVMPLLVLLLMGLASRASAATIIFDTCTLAGVCDQLFLQTTLRPDGKVSAVLTSPTVNVPNPLGFGINLLGFGQPGWQITTGLPGARYTGTGLSSFTPVPIGPYGTFNWSLDLNFPANPILVEHLFARPGGFTSDLGPFTPNALGFIAAAHVRNRITGVTGDVAARVPEPPVNPTPVPEPASMLLFGSGLALIARRVYQRSAGDA